MTEEQLARGLAAFEDIRACERMIREWEAGVFTNISRHSGIGHDPAGTLILSPEGQEAVKAIAVAEWQAKLAAARKAFNEL